MSGYVLAEVFGCYSCVLFLRCRFM